jgi:hypothetical protein
MASRFTFAAPDATYFCAAQQLTAAGTFLLNGDAAIGNAFYGIAPINVSGLFMRNIAIASTGNLSTVNFTVTGIDGQYNALSETIAGPNNGIVQTVQYFYQVQSVAANAAVSTNVTVGTGTLGASLWFKPNTNFVSPFNVSIRITVEQPSVVYTIQDTDYGTAGPPVPPGIVPSNRIYNSQDPNVVNASSTQFTSYTLPVEAIRVLINSSSGGLQNLTAAFTQAGLITL